MVIVQDVNKQCNNVIHGVIEESEKKGFHHKKNECH
jgi:hypothetical protein